MLPEPFSPKGIFSFLSLPLELRQRIYTELLVPSPPSSTIDLYYTWSYADNPRLRFNQTGPYVESSILLTNKQIHTEGSDVLFSRATLSLRCDPSLRMPFPQCPLQDVGVDEPFKVRGTHREGDKLFAGVLRRFKAVTVVWVMRYEDIREADTRDFMYFGEQYGYSPSEMRSGIQGLKTLLGALAVLGCEGRGGDCEGREDPERTVLELDLEWPEEEEKFRKCTANEFEALWKKEGIWGLLKEVGKVRTVGIGGSAHSEFGREWL